MSYTPDFEVEPPKPSGIFQWVEIALLQVFKALIKLYVYLNSLLELVIGFYYPGQIQELATEASMHKLKRT